MMLRYTNLIVTGEDATYSLAQLMLAVHGYNAARAENDRIAVAFPTMQDAVVSERGKVMVKATLGTHLRLFAVEALLNEFLASPIPSKLARLGAVVRSKPAVVPAGAGAVRFVRDRRFEKTHQDGAYARRQRARATEQGREYFARQKQAQPESVGISLKSKSTEREFYLDVRREAGTAVSGELRVNSYGLCSAETSVPMF